MKKSQELETENSCWNKATDDELVFVLLGRDKATPAAICAWARERCRLGLNTVNDPKIVEAWTTAKEIADALQTEPKNQQLAALDAEWALLHLARRVGLKAEHHTWHELAEQIANKMEVAESNRRAVSSSGIGWGGQ